MIRLRILHCKQQNITQALIKYAEKKVLAPNLKNYAIKIAFVQEKLTFMEINKEIRFAQQKKNRIFILRKLNCSKINMFNSLARIRLLEVLNNFT